MVASEKAPIYNLFPIPDQATAERCGIYFFYETPGFTLVAPERLRTWIRQVVAQQGRALTCLNYIFGDDAQLHVLNKRYLQHDNWTDILTFPHDPQASQVAADIYISLERVADNAQALGLVMEEELYRVMIHGVLHLLGHRDATPAEQQAMRCAETACLAMASSPLAPRGTHP